jgi:predicted nucleotidyltransferase
MDNLGETIRKLREENKLPLRTIAAYLDIDQAILSKMERGQRRATREQVVKLAQYFRTNESDLLVSWLSDKLVYEIADEQVALKALHAAEEKISYLSFQKINREEVKNLLIAAISKFSAIKKVWIFGSFSRKTDGPSSDIDLAIQADVSFSYFDLAEVQYQLERSVNRKVDVGFIDSFKPYILEHIKPDLTLIYERPA